MSACPGDPFVSREHSVNAGRAVVPRGGESQAGSLGVQVWSTHSLQVCLCTWSILKNVYDVLLLRKLTPDTLVPFPFVRTGFMKASETQAAGLARGRNTRVQWG